jgi:Spy/CpxP family protein refolding chaperone
MKTLRKLFTCLVLSLIMQAVAAPAFAQGFKWWQTERFQKELVLTTDQITRIEGIYQATDPLLRAQKKAIDRHEEKLSKVIQDPKSDEAMLLQANERLDAARNEVSRTRTLMLFRIRRVMTDEQNLKINAMHAKDRADRENREKSDRDRKGNSKGPGKDDHNHSDCR